MIELEGPVGLTFRDVRYGDEDAVFELCQAWTADGKRFTRERARQAVHKYVRDMEIEPGDHPATADSRYREALIAFGPTGEPLALIVYVVRGANDPKNWPLAICTLTTEVFAINPASRSPAVARALLATLMRSAFEDTGADVLTHELLDTPEMRDHLADRAYSDPVLERETPRGTRIAAAFTRADHLARMASRPAESAARHVFTQSQPPTD